MENGKSQNHNLERNRVLHKMMVSALTNSIHFWHNNHSNRNHHLNTISQQKFLRNTLGTSNQADLKVDLDLMTWIAKMIRELLKPLDHKGQKSLNIHPTILAIQVQ